MPSDDSMRELMERLVERLDVHLAHSGAQIERGNELMLRGNELMERNEVALERNEHAFERNTRAFERNTRAYDNNVRAWGDTTAAMVAVGKSLEDLGDDLRAHTRGLLQVLDRLDDSGAQGA